MIFKRLRVHVFFGKLTKKRNTMYTKGLTVFSSFFFFFFYYERTPIIVAEPGNKAMAFV